VTVTAPTVGGYLTVYPTGTPAPLASNLNFEPDQTIPNLVTVRIGAGGKVSLLNSTDGTVHMIADVAGYYLAGSASVPGAFVPLAPTRVLDTRNGNGTGGVSGPVAAGTSIDLQATGRGGVPANNVGAIVMNTTVTAPVFGGYVVVFPTGASPLASNLNFVPGQTIPNLVIVKVGDGGKVTLRNPTPGTLHLIGDVAGYFLG
jgi:hypothetical protein